MTVTTSNEGGVAPEPETASTWMLGPSGMVTVTGGPASESATARMVRPDGGELPLNVVASIELLRKSLLQNHSGPRYSPVDRLGAGSQGVVWRVSDRDCRRELAFKLLSADSASSEDMARFIVEAQITAQLEHPGIPPVHDIGRLSDGTLYYSMKCVEGMHLADHLATRAGREEHRFALLQIFLSICQTVAFAHSKGVIHRDLKPKNVMVGRYGEVLIMDWGLAKLIGSDEDSSAVRSDRMPLSDDAYQTMRGTAVGTPAYMSPEQVAGDAAGLDRRCDVYSLGVMLYELLAGVSPYERGDVQRVLRQCRDGTWARLDRRKLAYELPRPLMSIVHRAMATARDRRYPSVEALADDIRAFLAGDPVAAHADGAITSLLRHGRHHRAALRAMVTIVALALLGAGGVWLLGERMERAAANELRAQAEQEESLGRLDLALGTVQRLQDLRPGDAWAMANQERLRAELKHRAEEGRRHQGALSRSAQDRHDAQVLAVRAKASASKDDEASLQRAVDDYLAAIALAGDDPTLRAACQAASTRLVEVRRSGAVAKQLEVALAGADAHLVAAQRAFVKGRQLAEQAEQQRTEASRLRLRPDASSGRRIAELEEAAARTGREAAAHDADGVEALESALRLVPEHREARRAMADWCVRALCAAEAREDATQVAVLAARARRCDVEGRYTELLDGLGRVVVPADAAPVELQALQPGPDQVLRPDGKVRAVTSGSEEPLPAGHWLVRAGGAVHALRLARGERRELRFADPPPLPDGMTAITAATVCDRHGRPIASLPAFALAIREVTCAEYLLFLNDPATQSEMAAAAAAGRVIRLPRSSGDRRTPLWSRIRGGFALLTADGSAIPAGRPVTGISVGDASAFARWRSGRDGRAWRLPTRLEWCAAVQAGDGRPFPWGLRFAPGLVLDHAGEPAVGGSHPADATPGGLLDLAGSVAELTAAESDATWACGGSFRDLDPERFSADSARLMALDAVDETVGFRLALTLP